MSNTYGVELNRLDAGRSTVEMRDSLWRQLEALYQGVDENYLKSETIRELLAYAADDNPTLDQGREATR